tara:strand:+ start:4366 stop:4818 length:453 start_codon:yes stop_codon:yes gene_type:complete
MKIAESILPSLGRTVKSLDLYVEEKMYEADIPLSKLQLIFLKIISVHNAQAQSSLAELTGRDKTTFTRNINTLERKKLVTRKSCATDKRVKLVCITPLGRTFVEKAMPILEGIVDEVEVDISAEEKAQFLTTLEKIKNKLIEVRTKNNIQ